MGCCSWAVKYFLIIFNAIFCLGGIALIVIGSIIQWNFNNYGSLLPGNVAVPGIVIIVVGCITLIVASIGGLGLIRESHCLILTFAVGLVSIFILQATGGILAIVFQSHLGDVLRQTMKNAMELYPTSEEDGPGAKRAWDLVQKKFRCCGIDDQWDWIYVPGMSNNPPDSCKCTQNDARCVGGIYIVGCFKDLSAWFVMIETILGVVSISVALVGAIAAISLASAIKRRMHTV